MTTPQRGMKKPGSRVSSDSSVRRVWNRLQPTQVESVRHCTECQRDVHLALTEEDFRKHSEEGRCIAVPVLQNNTEGDSDRAGLLAGTGRHALQWSAQARVKECGRLLDK